MFSCQDQGPLGSQRITNSYEYTYTETASHVPYAMRQKPRVVAVVGPTSSGKTDAAIAVAKKFNGEIIVADSRQVYRRMDIGTNKARGTWQIANSQRVYSVNSIPYWGIDLVEPDEIFTVQQWKGFALKTINAIVARGRLPVIEGGTGLYVWALLDNLTIPEVPPDQKLRAKIEERIRRSGLASVIKEVLQKDPGAQTFLQLDNPRRVIRALEVIRKTGLPYSTQRRKGPKPFNDIRIGIDPGIRVVDCAIETRARERFARGLHREVRELATRYGWDVPAMSGIGYAEWRPRTRTVLRHDAGRPQTVLPTTSDSKRPVIRTDRDKVLEENIRRNKQFARAQRKWFRRDPAIHWVKNKREAVKEASIFLRPTKEPTPRELSSQ